MIRHLTLILLALTLVTCAKKPVVQEPPPSSEAGSGEGNPDIVSDPLTVNPNGSDSQQIEGLGTIYFAYDQAQLSGESKKTLEGNANWMKSNSGYMLQVEGHCDSRGTTEYNLALGERRAKAVRAYLVSLGVDANRMSVMSYGEEKPIVPGDDEGSFTKNRRANFLPMKK